MSEHAPKRKKEEHKKEEQKEKHKKEPSANELSFGIKALIDKGLALEMELISNPELYDTDAMNKKVKEWKKSVKAFKKENEHYMEKSQRKTLKILKKKAEYLGD